MTEVVQNEILDVGCKECGAQPGKPCRIPGRIMLPFTHHLEQEHFSFHPQRILYAKMKKVMPGFGDGMTASTKALITYYAFVMMCDSVSTKSKELLGAELSSQAVQAFFAHEAIKELRKDGLIA